MKNKLLSYCSQPAALICSAVALASSAFWFATAPLAQAQDGVTNCQVCHKRSQTLTFPCSSLEYRRHLDHGDAMGACMVTPVSNP
ncbi:MAG TPA: hypothetical protein VG095_07600 [Chthoniobacterales bacterium]|nr:hypothetical protein [Chthoniobacterales bacterium]